MIIIGQKKIVQNCRKQYFGFVFLTDFAMIYAKYQIYINI